jgi:hypothetical protein
VIPKISNLARNLPMKTIVDQRRLLNSVRLKTVLIMSPVSYILLLFVGEVCFRCNHGPQLRNIDCEKAKCLRIAKPRYPSKPPRCLS